MKNFNLLTTPLQFSQHDYAIIDRALIGDLGDLEKKLPLIEMVPVVLQSQSHLYPYVLDLKKVKFDIWEIISEGVKRDVNNANYPMFSMLYKSNLSPEQFSTNLANILIINDSSGNKYSCRYYDPYVFFHLLWILSSSDLSTFSKITGIDVCTFTLKKEWFSISFLSDSNHEFINSFEKHVDKLKIIKTINEVIRRNGSLKDKSLFGCIDVAKRIYDSIILAHDKYQLRDNEDVISFSSHYLNIGSGFHYHPEILKILSNQFASSDSYLNLTNKITDKEWMNIHKYCLELNREGV